MTTSNPLPHPRRPDDPADPEPAPRTTPQVEPDDIDPSRQAENREADDGPPDPPKGPGPDPDDIDPSSPTG
ncbi:hypothetical protein [Cellulomonas olei]|uniref:hypothetical protein n=1 Tax=Cellulomonas sp. P4 TaxID=3142533 RepID=UPI0031BA0985